MKQPKVFVIVLNWNRAADTIECLSSVIRLSAFNYQLSVVVVDNASTDGSLAKIKNQIASFKNNNQKLNILENKENLGYAGGNNVGIKYAFENKADYIVVLNNDTRVAPKLIEYLLEPAETDRKVGLASPKIYFEKGFEFHKAMYKKESLGKVIWYAGGIIDWKNAYGSTRGVDEIDNGQYDMAEETDFATGTCVLITRKLIEKIGMFDEKYYLYYEDTDLSQRATKAGFKVIYQPKGIVWHKVARSSGIGSGLNDYFITRNRMLFGMKYAQLRTKVALLRESINLLLTGRIWQKIGIRDFYLGKFGKGTWK